MKNIIHTLISNRKASLLSLSLIFILGIALLLRIPVNFYPKTSKPSFRIDVRGTGMAAEDMYNDYNTKIQSAISDVAQLESSTVTFGPSFIRVVLEFPWRASVKETKIQAQNFANDLKTILPSNLDEPTVSYDDDGSSGFLATSFYSATLSSQELYDQALSLYEDEFSSLKGVDYMYITPVRELTAEVIFDPDALLNFGLTVDNIISRVNAEYQTISLGAFRDGNQRFTVRSVSPIDNIFKLKEIPVATIGDQTILLDNVAEVTVFYDLPSSISRVNGEAAVLLAVFPTQDANVKAIAEQSLEIIKRKLPLFSKTVEADVLVNPAEFIDNAISNVLNSALVGAFLAMIVTLAFLGIFRNTVVVILAIPISVIYAFILLHNFDVSINLISLSGLAIAVGMSLDAAIVVMENIHRHRMENLEKNTNLSLKAIIINATSEVAQPVFMSALTTIAVFLPLKYTSPLASAILGDLALAIVFTLASSILVSFTIIPLMAYYFFKKEYSLYNNQTVSIKTQTTLILRISQSIMNFLLYHYKKGLIFFLKNKKRGLLLILVSSILFVLSLFLIFTLPFTIIEDPLSSSLTIYASNSEIDDVNDFILEFEPIEKQILTLLGDSIKTRFFSTSGNSAGQLFLNMNSTAEATRAISLLNQELISDNIWSFNIDAYNPASMPIPETLALQISVSGSNRQTVYNYLDRIADLAMELKNTDDTRAYSRVRTVPNTNPTNEILLKAKEEAFISIPEYSRRSLASLAYTYINGSKPLTFKLDNGQEMRPLFSFPAITNKESLYNILIPYDGSAIPLSYFFDIVDSQGISSLLIKDRNITTEVRASAPPSTSFKNLVKYEKELDTIIKENITFDSGYSYKFLDARAVINDSLRSLTYAFITSILLVFLILTIQFNSFKLSVIILLAIPLGVIGAVLSLKFSGLSMSINSMLGMILLGGIAVNNSLLIVDFYINNKNTLQPIDAIMQACVLRFPAILSTTVTTLLGMIPLALAIGDGANVIQSLGVAVSGGLALSTFFTLFLIPVVLSIFTVQQTN